MLLKAFLDVDGLKGFFEHFQAFVDASTRSKTLHLLDQVHCLVVVIIVVVDGGSPSGG